MLIFCCHKCHTLGENRTKTKENAAQRWSKKHVFLRCFHLNLARNPLVLLNYIQIYDITNWKIEIYIEHCDTCDSKNIKTLGCAYVRVRARECDYRYFCISFFCFFFLQLSRGSRFQKQPVTFHKTSCHFQQNDPSFLRKRPVVWWVLWEINQDRRRSEEKRGRAK